MSERRVAAVTETVRDDRMDVTPHESRNVLAFLVAALPLSHSCAPGCCRGRGRFARLLLCASQLVAARGSLPGSADVAVAGSDAARRRAAGFLVQRGHVRGGHVLAVHQHPYFRRSARLDRLAV